jgi:hypothetical protein
MTFGSKNKIILNTWDRFILPLPFTRCNINFGSPIYLASRSSEELIEEKRIELESSLKQLDKESDTA